MGTAPLGNLYKAISEDEANATLEKAWEIGAAISTPHRSTASALAETRMNRFLKGKPRDEYSVHQGGSLMEVCKPEDRTGIGKFFDTPTRREQFDYSYNGIMRSLRRRWNVWVWTASISCLRTTSTSSIRAAAKSWKRGRPIFSLRHPRDD